MYCRTQIMYRAVQPTQVHEATLSALRTPATDIGHSTVDTAGSFVPVSLPRIY
ncbi:hypothetical protein PISMIDRAFT_681803 [Pisolithus microcarpus 441]|uniref:Uncharacterized protein n=1 Tax=Pisolithus microcarpus 441 TaxID=765257 RepID=A0A0C9YW61_9AGAM|nr:hypothetical protein PISMIDRAFT_681803 [Pisolithus microcarpus 441]